MFTRLIESRRARERGAGGTAASIFAHAAVMGGLTWATLGAAPSAPTHTTPEIVVWSQIEPKPVHVWQGVRQPPGCDADCPISPIPPQIPDVPIVIGEAPITPEVGFPAGPPGPREPVPTLVEVGGDTGVYETVDQPAVPSPGNTRPVYPAILRNSRIAGVVSARFVVDSTGRVEPASIKIENASEGLFEASVRHALLSWRFTPATANGHRVRLQVTEDFNFTLTP